MQLFDYDKFTTMFQAKIRALREDLNLSIPKMAAFWGIPHGTYKNYELGYRRVPTMALLKLFYKLKNDRFGNFGHQTTIFNYFFSEEATLPNRTLTILKEIQEKDNGRDPAALIFQDEFILNDYFTHLRKHVFKLSRTYMCALFDINIVTIKNYERNARSVGLDYFANMIMASDNPTAQITNLITTIERHDFKRFKEHGYIIDFKVKEALKEYPEIPKHYHILP